MIFTKADREIILGLERALTGLRLDVRVKANSTGKNPLSLHVRLNDAFALLNELGAAVGRIESAIKPLSKLGLEIGARQTDRKVLDEIMSGYNSDRILEFEDNKKTLNRRADELLDTVRGRNDITNNAIVALSGRLSKIESALQDLQKFPSMDEQIQSHYDALYHTLSKQFVTKPQRKARRKKK